MLRQAAPRRVVVLLAVGVLLAGVAAAQGSSDDDKKEAPATCPCDQPQNWQQMFKGKIWQNFAQGLFDASTSACAEDRELFKIVDDPSDAVLEGAAVDTSIPECQVFSDSESPAMVLSVTAAEAEVCRDMLRQAASSEGVRCR